MNSPKSANKFLLFFNVYSLLLPFAFLMPLKSGVSKITILQVQDIFLFAIPILIYIIVTGRKFTDLIPLNKISIKNCGYVILITILSLPILVLISTLSSLFVTDISNADITEYIGNMTMFQCVFSLAIAPAVFEELMVRGVLLSNYKTTSPIVMYIISGLFFGIIHMNFQQMSYAIFAGILFAFFVHQTNSIFSSMLAHFFINGYQAIGAKLLYNTDKISEFEVINESISYTDNLYSVGIYFVVALVFMPFLIATIKNFKKYNKENADKYLNNEVGTNKKFIDIYFILSVVIFIFYAILFEIVSKYSGTLVG
ncbi:MAG: lysostaphin resistance A-like protein [Lachnospirales bacterium]